MLCDHGLYLVYLLKKKRFPRHAYGGVSNVAYFITVNEQPHYNRGCYLSQAGYASRGRSIFLIRLFLKPFYHKQEQCSLNNNVNVFTERAKQ